jgi:hypothetical protein
MAPLHHELLPSDLATSLGHSFLMELLYPAFLNQGYSLVVPGQGALLISDQRPLISPTKVLPTLLRHPKSLTRILEFVLRSRRVEVDLSEFLEIGFIFSRKGCGRALIQEARRRYAGHGLYALTDTAGGFYQKAGFLQRGFERRGTRQLEIWVDEHLDTTDARAD